LSATVDTDDPEILSAIQHICRRDPLSGRVVTSGIVTARDSKWLLSWTINRQPQFKTQPKGHVLVWVYAPFTDREGDFVKKPMRECTGAEACEEWLYHVGIPEDRIVSLAQEHANTTTCYMPYITAFFMPRNDTDRPKVVPEGAVNFAFIGQFARSRATPSSPPSTPCAPAWRPSTRCAMWIVAPPRSGAPSTMCVACLTLQPKDGRKVTDMKLPLIERKALETALRKVKSTDIEKLLKEYGVI
jgi:oleate hydratase